MLNLGPVVVRAAATNRVTVEMLPGQPLPKVDAELKENTWDLGTIGAGTGVGGIVALVTGRPALGLLGPLVFYIWGRIRWRQSQR